MDIAVAQREVRTEFLGGFVGQNVSGVIWAVSAALGTWRSPAAAIWTLLVGGFLIFPLTLLGLRAMGRATGRRNGLGVDNPMGQLATQLVFTLNLPLIAAATLYRLDWFYPACLMGAGAHYVPFVFLYGMRSFAVLAGVMMAAAFVIAMVIHGPFALGGWLGSAALIVFAFIGRAIVERESKSDPLRA